MFVNNESINDRKSNIRELYNEINLCNFNMNKKEDDLKNIINEKDLIIKEMNKKIIKQENKIIENEEQIKILNKTLQKVIHQLNDLNKFKNKIKTIVKYDEYVKKEKETQLSQLTQLLNLNTEISYVDDNINEKKEEDIIIDENSDENKEEFYDEYDDFFEKEKIIVNNNKPRKKGKKKNEKKEKNIKDENSLETIDKKKDEEDYMLIGKKIPTFEKNILKEEKMNNFHSNIIKSEEQLNLIKKCINMYFPKINKLYFNLNSIVQDFPLDITQIKENLDLLLNKDLLFVVETFDNNIICLGLNKCTLPKKCFYLFVNDNKIFYYKKKRGNENIEEKDKNEFYRDENYHKRYKYNKDKIENIGELKSFFFDGFFRLINDFEESKCKEIEIFEILTE